MTIDQTLVNESTEAVGDIEHGADVPSEGADTIEEIYVGECSSISGRSTLTYAFGRRSADQSVHLRIVKNSGRGICCVDWASASAIDRVIEGKSQLTAKTFRALHPSKSLNTDGFLLAVVKDLGLICVSPLNARHHDHVPGTSCESVLQERLATVPSEKTARAGKGQRRSVKAS